jgi:hypothetical protein
MTTKEIIIHGNEDEGPHRILVDGEHVCTTSYDEDGSDGMRKILQLTRDLGAKLGAKIIEEYE